MSIFVAKRLSLLSIFILASFSAFPQTNQDQSDTGTQPAPVSANVTQGPTIQYADDEFAVITWTTDQPFASRIFYGKDAGNLNQIAEDGKSLSMRHQVDLRNLQPNTTYYFRIDTGQGTAAAASVDNVNGFQTTALGANPVRNQPPFKGSMQPAANPAGQSVSTPNFGNISITRGPTIQYLDDTTAVISWTTNVPASNTLYYGTDSSNLLDTGGDFKDATEHRVHLSNLKPNTRYYFEFDEPSSTQPVANFTTTSPGAQPLYDQKPAATVAGGERGSGPQLTHREHGADHSNELPSGTEIFLNLDNPLSTKASHPGDRFSATVAQPVRDLNDQIVIPTSARVKGQVTESEEGKNLPTVRGRGKLNMRFENIVLPNGNSIPISATLLSVNQSGGNGSVNSEGEVQSETKASTAAKGVGVGAGIGTIAGLILGGPFKGLAIGAIAGGGYILATKGKDVELPQDTGLKIRLDQPISLGRYTARPNPQR